MGVVNVTPDSFSDGGVNFRAEDAIASARRMLDEGAAIVDVGGESTRPGAEAVPLDEELRRVVPVLEGLHGMPVSIDTSKAEVARRALELGAELVNDVTALRGDTQLAGVVAEAGAFLCVMHMQGEPRTMQAEPRYDDVVAEVAAFLEERLAFAVEAGIPEERICLDPGIGFGKTLEHNLELVRRLDVLLALGRPVVVGFSRKRSLGRLLGEPEATTGSLAASLAAAVAAYERGATILRVHDVRETVEALRVVSAVAAQNPGTVPKFGTVPSVILELHGLEVFGRHGVLDEEKLNGQVFVYDVELEVDQPAADRIDAAVDYRLVADCVREVSYSGSFELIETLAAVVADALLARLAVSRVRVRVRKPLPADIAAEWSAATVERSR